VLTSALIAIVVALKFAIPAFLPRFPFQAGWANFVLDSVDGDLLIPLGLDDPIYQRIDKAADWVTYAFMVGAGWRWPIRRWLVALFAFRTVGQAIFFLTEDERIFFVFANFLEPLFLAYASILFFKKQGGHAFYLGHRIAVWSVVVLYKLQDEWFTHIANVDRSDLARRLLGL
jgi:hypothetical protein